MPQIDGDLVPDMLLGVRSTGAGPTNAGALAVVLMAAASYPASPPTPPHLCNPMRLPEGHAR